MKSIHNNIETLRCIPFDPRLPDDIVAECAAPCEPFSMIRDRRAQTAHVVFYCDDADVPNIQRRLDEAELELDAIEF